MNKALYILIILGLFSCKPVKLDFTDGPSTIIYKMKGNYSKLVPVTMDDAKEMIVSYPSPKDIYTNGKIALPVPLKNGYWLDNRGLDENSVFLKYTYEEYAAMESAPSKADMIAAIVDKNPFEDICDCGNRYKYGEETVKMMEKVTKRNDTGKCKKILKGK